MNEPTTSREFLDKIAELAAIFTPTAEMAVHLGMPHSSLLELLHDKTTPAAQVYNLQRAKLLREVREMDLAAARKGDQEALNRVHEYLKQSAI